VGRCEDISLGRQQDKDYRDKPSRLWKNSF
jgi:hypothetical protein